MLDRYNFLCLNEKEETSYRTYDGYKSTLNVTLQPNNSPRIKKTEKNMNS